MHLMLRQSQTTENETLMFNRHRHTWDEVGRYAQPPAKNIKVGGGFYGNEVTDLIYGWTMVELKCTDCGALTSTKLPYTGPIGRDDGR